LRPELPFECLSAIRKDFAGVADWLYRLLERKWAASALLVVVALRRALMTYAHLIDCRIDARTQSLTMTLWITLALRVE